MAKAGVIRKVAKIKEHLQHASPTERTHLIARLDKYDAVWVALALSATKRTFRKPSRSYPWSPTLAQTGVIARYWKKRLLKCRMDGLIEHPDVPIPNQYSPPPASSEEEILDHYLVAIHKWHTTKGQAAQLRNQHLEDLIQQTMEERDLKRETAIKIILHWKEMQNLHKRHKGIMT